MDILTTQIPVEEVGARSGRRKFVTICLYMLFPGTRHMFIFHFLVLSMVVNSGFQKNTVVNSEEVNPFVENLNSGVRKPNGLCKRESNSAVALIVHPIKCDSVALKSLHYSL